MDYTGNLTDLFHQRADSQPQQPLILGPDHGQQVTYGDFQRQLWQLADELATAGVRTGANIGVQLPNGSACILATYAAWSCRASVTPIPLEFAPPERQQLLAQIAIDGVLTTPDQLAPLEPFASGRPVALSWELHYVPLAPQRPPPPALADLNPAFIRFTSGTTGAAKGVVLSHQTIAERIAAANAGLMIGPRDRVVWLLSMAYHFAVTIVAYLSFGATIVLCQNHFGPTIVQTAARQRATLLYAAPLHYQLMSHDASDTPLSDVRLAIATTASLRPQIGEAFQRRFGIALNETYGIIEVGLPAINLAKPQAKRGSVGPLQPAYRLRLDKGHPDDPIGEILIQGPGLLDSYYHPWRPRAELLAQRDGWFATGDLGRLDEEGYLAIVGRRKEIINTGGHKLFPQEVETVLERHPAVVKACVFGRPDRRRGEAVHAHLVLTPHQPRPTAAELHAFCQTELSAHKLPEGYWQVLELAYTASGKLIRDGEQLAANAAATPLV